MKRNLLLLILLIIPISLLSQVTFTNSNSSLNNSNVNSGVAIGVGDMNGDGLDDIVRLDNSSSLEIEYQNASGNFTRLDYGSIGGSAWGICIADVDENGYNDIIAGGAYNGIKLLLANSDGSNYSSSTLSNPSIFVQNINFADIDNNGTTDVFICHDDGVSSPYSNNGSGSMTYDLNLINTASTEPSDNSGNYGSIWTDYDNDGDLDLYISKCRLGVSDPDDGRRLNLMFQNDGSGNFTEVAPACGLQPKAQSWAAAFEDIDNDGDMDCVLINHDITSMIFENTGSGSFTDITASSGISTQLSGLGNDGIQVIMEDFNNDTYVDIFITSKSSDFYLFTNDGDNTFTEETTPFPGNDNIQSAAVGDLNNDGFVDVIAGYANGFNGPSSTDDRLYLNDGNSNNWSKVKLNGVASNINGIGARVEIDGTWGTQIREVRSGESYGTVNSMISHFGLASATAITKITVKWPSGTEDIVLNPNINEQIEIAEGETLNISQFEIGEFKVSPNPVTSELVISGSKIANLQSIELYDITGKKVDLVQPENFETQRFVIKVSHLNSGLYLLKAIVDSQVLVSKIIKE